MMKAASITAPQRVAVTDVAIPKPAQGEVRIRIEGCGVCGSNVPPWSGRPWFTYPMPAGSPGHEPWGTVDDAGPGTSVPCGTRVAFLSERAFAEYAVAKADDLVVLPQVLDGQPVPGEPLACAVNVITRSRIQPGERVAVVGAGFLGALVIALARAAGAHVEAWSRRSFALDTARSFGAAVTRRVDEGGCGLTFDCVIEAAGEQVTLDLASVLVRERGRLVIAGYHQDAPRTVDMQSWNWRGLDVINAHERDSRVYLAGMRAGIALLSSGAIDPRPLYTHMFPLADIGDAFRVAATRPDGFMKALVTT